MSQDNVGYDRNTDYDDPQVMADLRARQKSRSLVMAVILAGLCVLFFAITIVKMGLWG